LVAAQKKYGKKSKWGNQTSVPPKVLPWPLRDKGRISNLAKYIREEALLFPANRGSIE